MYKSVCKEDGAGKGKKMAQGKIACRPAFARLNAIRCGGGMTPFSHHNSSQATYVKHTQSSPASHIQQKEKPFPEAIRTSGKKEPKEREKPKEKPQDDEKPRDEEKPKNAEKPKEKRIRNGREPQKKREPERKTEPKKEMEPRRKR